MALLMNTASNSLEHDICPLISDYLTILLNRFHPEKNPGNIQPYHKIIKLGGFAFYKAWLCSPRSNVTDQGMKKVHFENVIL